MNTRIMQTGNNKPEELTVGQKVLLIEDVEKFGATIPKGTVAEITHLCPSSARLKWDGMPSTFYEHGIMIRSELFVPSFEKPKGKGKVGRPKGSRTRFKVGTLVVINGEGKSQFYADKGAIGIVLTKERDPMVYVLTGYSPQDRRWWFAFKELTKANPESAGDQIRRAISDYDPRWDDVRELLTQIREGHSRWWFAFKELTEANPEAAGDQLISAISGYDPRWDDVQKLLTQIREGAGE